MSLPQVQRYQDLLKHDLAVFELLTQAAKAKKPPEDVSDWQVTLLFYLACVYVKLAGCLYSKRFDDHISLRQWINTENDMLAITRDYRKLEEASRDARHEGRRFAPVEIRSVQLRRFESVQDHVVAVVAAKGVPGVTRIDPAKHL
jgi:hypothetical protein